MHRTITLRTTPLRCQEFNPFSSPYLDILEAVVGFEPTEGY